MADKPMSYPEWRGFIDHHILQTMAESGRSYTSPTGVPEWFFGLNNFTNDWITREMASAFLKDLTRQGFAQYRSGLFNDDGETAGAGYGITKLGLDRYRELATHRQNIDSMKIAANRQNSAESLTH